MKINMNQRNFKYGETLKTGYNGAINCARMYSFVRSGLKPTLCDIDDIVNDVNHKGALAIDPNFISDKLIKEMLFTNKTYSGVGLSVPELNVLSYTTLLASALKEAITKIDQLEQNVLRLDQENNTIKERLGELNVR